MRRLWLLFWVILALLPGSDHRAWCQFSGPGSAATVPAESLVQAADLAALLKAGKAPAILQVGSRVFFEQAHIPAAVYAGPGSQQGGLQALENAVLHWPKDHFIVLYCGCCPWNRCPNVGPAFQRMKELGYTKVKVLYLPNNFGDDWVAKGYPTEKK